MDQVYQVTYCHQCPLSEDDGIYCNYHRVVMHDHPFLDKMPNVCPLNDGDIIIKKFKQIEND